MLNESKFNMWRATIYLVIVDGKITNQEKKWLEDYAFKAPYSEEQKKIIQQDLKNFNANFKEIFEKITHPPDRAMLLHFANILFKKDQFDQTEEDFLKKLNDAVMKKIDIQQAISSLKSNANSEINKSKYQKAYEALDKFTFLKD